MKESEIRKKVIAAHPDWVVWFPAKVKYQETDIFGVFDLLLIKKNSSQLKWIQLTSYSNVPARKKKILAFFSANLVFIRNAEIWGWNESKKEFRVVKLDIRDIACG